jgi:hypothetical protein
MTPLSQHKDVSLKGHLGPHVPEMQLRVPSGATMTRGHPYGDGRTDQKHFNTEMLLAPEEFVSVHKLRIALDKSFLLKHFYTIAPGDQLRRRRRLAEVTVGI